MNADRDNRAAAQPPAKSWTTAYSISGIHRCASRRTYSGDGVVPPPTANHTLQHLHKRRNVHDYHRRYSRAYSVAPRRSILRCYTSTTFSRTVTRLPPCVASKRGQRLSPHRSAFVLGSCHSILVQWFSSRRSESPRHA